MVMSKKERERLERILDCLERGLGFVDKPSTFLAIKAGHGDAMAFSRTVNAGQVEHVLRRDDPLAYVGEQHIHVVNKHIGSEFALIRTARRELAAFLSPVTVEGPIDE
jgi:hypothetical protein